ncbi:MAG: hypothetical protein RBJ76_13705 [Stenomitos frigidus ULC029]
MATVSLFAKKGLLLFLTLLMLLLSFHPLPASAAPAQGNETRLFITKNKTPRFGEVGKFLCFSAGGKVRGAGNVGLVAGSMLINVGLLGDPSLRLKKSAVRPVTGIMNYKGTVKQAGAKLSPTALGSNISANFLMRGSAPHILIGQGAVTTNEGLFSLQDAQGRKAFKVTCPAIEEDEDVQEDTVADLKKYLRQNPPGSALGNAFEQAAAILVGIIAGLASLGGFPANP